eukprot:TRINITY_DN2500_c0_g1_i1.p1 TRINITY_DN2500_c0_g1~~TRINITY_DN2500_c0_g1_i1.p1  ORF type:complete len:517 (-),score=131.08 TRINITY_DN2500_c0_g1_i1:26-1516(-)
MDKQDKFIKKKLETISLIKDIHDQSEELTRCCAYGTHDEVWDLYISLEKKIQKLRARQVGNERFQNPYDEQRDYTPFIQWLGENGVPIQDDLDVIFNHHEGHGFIAKRDYEEGELIASVPLDLMMTNKTALEGSVALLVAKDNLFQQIDSLPLALHLITERYKLRSKWRQYIDTLPKAIRLPLFWNSEKIQLLKGSPTFIDVIKQKSAVARQYSHVWKTLNNFEDLVLKRDAFTYDIFRWAYGTIYCRKNRIPLIGKSGKPVDALSLIPVYDLFNHEDGDDITAEYSLETESIECRAKRSFKEGEQVYMFYGHRTNGDLFMNSGFVIENNKWDYITVLFSLIESDPLYAQKAQILAQHNIPERGLYMIYSSLQGGNPISIELIQFLRIFVITDAELLATQSHLAFLEEDRPISLVNESEAYGILSVKLHQLLSQYPTSLEEDLEILNDDSLDIDRQYIYKLLVSEKQILQDCLKFCTTKAKSLKKKIKDKERRKKN